MTIEEMIEEMELVNKGIGLAVKDESASVTIEIPMEDYPPISNVVQLVPKG
jgi:hypothetical protein